ncbi:hypothetical protein SELMODRAFT_448598 [Selaginella moellendorffii]|uniref:DUF4470 domain-containing protein n=1 Tax=Selaginella moellendorffii TaxID=88036 RepID=D8T8H0_SELML|nr:hypothetical protein SELMODRAFT_448598 [Selaginella moellendorffii]
MDAGSSKDVKLGSGIGGKQLSAPTGNKAHVATLECQKEDCKKACKSELMDEQFGEAPWGNVPAHGLLSRDGFQPPEEPSFCFAAPADLLNAIETVCRLPDSFRGRATFYVNDWNPQVAVKNFLMIELLRTFGRDAVDAVIALWYSSCLTP